jgi:hypothetical protein
LPRALCRHRRSESLWTIAAKPCWPQVASIRATSPRNQPGETPSLTIRISRCPRRSMRSWGRRAQFCDASSPVPARSWTRPLGGSVVKPQVLKLRKAPWRSSRRCHAAIVCRQMTLEGYSSMTSATSSQRDSAGRRTGLHCRSSAIRWVVASSSKTKRVCDGTRRMSGRSARPSASPPGSAEAAGRRKASPPKPVLVVWLF